MESDETLKSWLTNRLEPHDADSGRGRSNSCVLRYRPGETLGEIRDELAQRGATNQERRSPGATSASRDDHRNEVDSEPLPGSVSLLGCQRSVGAIDMETPLFVCYANCCRSVLAYYLYRHLHRRPRPSAGLYAGECINDRRSGC